MRSTFLLLTLLLFSYFAQAQGERILSYDSRVEVLKDGTIDVVETITVRALGEKIKHGIYRDFPTLYKRLDGGSLRVDFDLLGVTKDGNEEPYQVDAMSNGVRIYAGAETDIINSGEHTYTFHYRTKRQLGFFEDYDEIYWNVTGNGWLFPIDTVSARIILPEGASIVDGISAYSGPQGAKGCDCIIEKNSSNTVSFGTTARLDRREGLTVAVPFEKGLIAEPGTNEKLAYFFSDYRYLIIGFIGLFIVLIYYLWVWNKVGKDPEEGTIFPRFSPPGEMSPAAVGYMNELKYISYFDYLMNSSTRYVAYPATIVSMATKGYLNISGESATTFSLEKTGENFDQLSEEEKMVGEKLFDKEDKIELKGKNMGILLGAKKKLTPWLQENYRKPYFNLNHKYLAPGLFATFLIFFMVFMANPFSWPKGPFVFVIFNILTIALLFVFYFLVKAFRLKKNVFSNVIAFLILLIGTGVPLYFFAGPAFVIVLLLYWAFVVMNFIFINILKAPSIKGRALLDELDGFKMYLETAESDLLKVVDKIPAKTINLYERFLPYAMALRVESAWGDKFKDEIARAMEDKNYRPTWYRHGMFTAASLNHTITNSVSNAIVSSSTPASSSSGSGGSGSSGGGGGGGGGGGW